MLVLTRQTPREADWSTVARHRHILPDVTSHWKKRAECKGTLFINQDFRGGKLRRPHAREILKRMAFACFSQVIFFFSVGGYKNWHFLPHPFTTLLPYTPGREWIRNHSQWAPFQPSTPSSVWQFQLLSRLRSNLLLCELTAFIHLLACIWSTIHCQLFNGKLLKDFLRPAVADNNDFSVESESSAQLSSRKWLMNLDCEPRFVERRLERRHTLPTLVVCRPSIDRASVDSRSSAIDGSVGPTQSVGRSGRHGCRYSVGGTERWCVGGAGRDICETWCDISVEWRSSSQVFETVLCDAYPTGKYRSVVGVRRVSPDTAEHRPGVEPHRVSADIDRAPVDAVGRQSGRGWVMCSR